MQPTLISPWWLIEGDALAELAKLPPACIDAVCTDPPSAIGYMGCDWDKDKGGREEWIAWLQSILSECLRVLKPGGHALVWALPRTSGWTHRAIELAGFEVRDVVTHLFGTGFPKSLDFAADKAESHAQGLRVVRPEFIGTDFEDGWGTALKPAAEFWILARKPLDGTVAANVLEHGTGGLHIDACRVGTGEHKTPAPKRRVASAPLYTTASPDHLGGDDTVGGWPAHVVFSHAEGCYDVQGVTRCVPGCAVRLLDEQAPGKAEFFYCVKPSRKEREYGLDALPPKTAPETVGRDPESAGVQNPRAGAGRGAGVPRYRCAACGLHLGGGRAATACDKAEQHQPELIGFGPAVRNTHPTVKSTALMRYLLRLVTPPGGVVLDPFGGSMTTVIAAIFENFAAVAIELDRDYLEIGAARCNAWAAFIAEQREQDARQLTLFEKGGTNDAQV